MGAQRQYTDEHLKLPSRKAALAWFVVFMVSSAISVSGMIYAGCWLLQHADFF